MSILASIYLLKMERVFSVDGKRLVLGQLSVFSHESGYGPLGGTRSGRVPAAYVLKEANSYQLEALISGFDNFKRCYSLSCRYCEILLAVAERGRRRERDRKRS